MKKIILLFTFIFLSFSTAQNKKINQKNMELQQGYDDKQYQKIFPLMEKSLKNSFYKFPSSDEFRKKVIDLLGVDVNQYKTNDIYVEQPRGFYAILKNGKFIDFQEIERGSSKESLDDLVETYSTDNNWNDVFKNYNKILFNDDLSAVGKVIHDTDKYDVETIVLYLNYEKSKLLNAFFIKNLREFNKKQINYNEYFLWYNNLKRGIRKSLLSQVLESKPEFIEQLTQYLFDNRKKLERKVSPALVTETLAYLLQIQIQTGLDNHKDLNDNVGYTLLNNLSYEDDNFQGELKKHNFYGSEILKKYCHYFVSYREEQRRDREIEATYVINDPDGYTNLRKDANSQSPIIKQLKSGTDVIMLTESGNWFYVETSDKIKGYIHKSRLVKKY